MSSPTQGMWVCRHGVDGRDYCPECYAPRDALADAGPPEDTAGITGMAYNLTDEELAALDDGQLLELSDANIKMSRRLDAEMTRRGLVTGEPDE